MPTLTNISPNSATAGSGYTMITLTGNDFVATRRLTSTTHWITTNFVSAMQLTAIIPATDLTTAGTEPITVVNPTPDGGTSGAQTFTITNPAPTLTNISPNSATAGSGNTMITLTGTNFVSTSTADFNGIAITTNFVNAMQLTAIIPAADLTTPGTEPVTVFNPTPGGGTSSAQTFTITNPAPTLTNISPNSATAGSGNTMITLTGTNFVSNSTAEFNGIAIATTFVNATKLTAVIPAADLTTVGTEPITVVNPGPGGTSAAQTFTINNPTPTLTSISPTFTTFGSPDTTITLIGTKFVSSSTVDFNGTAIATTFVSATKLTAVIPAADLTTPEAEPITVVNPGPGGGTSSAQTFTIYGGPTLTLSPPTLPIAQLGFNYNQTITATGGTGPYSFFISAGALPTGLTLSTSGVLSGLVKASGNFNFTVQAIDATNIGSRSYSLTVSSTAITLTPSLLTAARVGAVYNATQVPTFSATGGSGPFTFAIVAGTGSLPAGLTLMPNGVLSGTPTAGGTFKFTVSATNASGTGTHMYTLVVNLPVITFSPLPQTTIPLGVQYSQSLMPTGGTAPGHALHHDRRIAAARSHPVCKRLVERQTDEKWRLYLAGQSDGLQHRHRAIFRQPALHLDGDVVACGCYTATVPSTPHRQTAGAGEQEQRERKRIRVARVPALFDLFVPEKFIACVPVER